MKKISILLFFVFSISLSFAQVQRTKTASKQISDSSNTSEQLNNTNKKGNKKQMIRELNLTKEQKGKLKEIKQANKAKVQQVQNDDKLTQEEKDVKLKTLHQEQAKNTLTVLNDEQKAKMKKMKATERKNKKEKTEMDNL
jgi:Flp pilus assembly protein TadG